MVFGIRARAALALSVLLACGHSQAQITVEGLTDQTVYTDRASFRIPSAPGYDYTATLRGEPVAIERSVPIDAPVEVSDPKQYYELEVERRHQTSGAVESQVLQFIVRASERADTEWGLPPWTPYPSIPSASAEFAGASLVLVAPAAFPSGLEIPMVALVRDGDGKRVGVNGMVRATGFPDHPVKLLRGVGSGALPPTQAAQTVSFSGEIGGIQALKEIAIDPATPAPWTFVSGTIAASTQWAPNSRIRVTGDLTVAAAATLTIGAGTVVQVAPGVSLEFSGRLVVEGTLANPVVFTAQSPSTPWGGLLFRASTSQADVAGAIFTRSGADPRWFDNVSGSGSSHRREQALVYMSNGARVTMTDCFLFDGAGQAAHGEGATFTLDRCLVQKFTTTGQFNGGTLNFTESAFIEFPSEDAPFADADNDAMYLSSGTRRLTDCLIGWTLDDGADGGGGATGPMYMHGCWFESTYHEGFALTDNGYREFRDTVVINCGQGLECGYDSPDGDVEGCFMTANTVGVRFGDNYDWDYNGSIKVTASLILHNLRDIWGRGWDTWLHHLSQMDLQGNHLTAADPLHPNNLVWNPAVDASRLDPFLPTPATSVGIGIAVRDAELDISRLAAGVPVRLSTFTKAFVSVDYAVVTDLGPAEEGTLVFTPGESLKVFHPQVPDPSALRWVRVTLANPVNGEITGIPEALYANIPSVTLLPQGSSWKYWDRGTSPGATWRDAGFNDTSWPAGEAELGGGEDDEATPIDIGPDGNRYPTIYFRHELEIADTAWITKVEVRLKRDDGAVVHVNGEEAFRHNMPSGAIGHGTFATGSVPGSAENSFFPAEIDPSMLVAGTNLIAVEVHQSDADSSDLSFDMEIVARGSASSPSAFVRGEVNQDGHIDLSDGVTILLVLFVGQATTCEDALDTDDTGVLEITDAIRLLQFLFLGGAPPPAPFPGIGEDPTPDDLSCSG